MNEQTMTRQRFYWFSDVLGEGMLRHGYITVCAEDEDEAREKVRSRVGSWYEEVFDYLKPLKTDPDYSEALTAYQSAKDEFCKKICKEIEAPPRVYSEADVKFTFGPSL